MQRVPGEVELGQDLHRVVPQLAILTLGADPERGGDPVRLRPRRCADHDVLDDGHRRVEREVLERPCHPPPRDARRRDVEQVLALEAHHAPCGVIDPADDVEERRLSRSVRPDQATDLPGLDREREIVEGDDPPEADGDLFHLQQGHVSSPRTSRRNAWCVHVPRRTVATMSPRGEVLRFRSRDHCATSRRRLRTSL